MLRAGWGLLWLAMGFHAVALDTNRSLFQYSCQTWKRQNGLVADAIGALLQTQDGYLWLGTSAGLVRFDGNEFKLFDPARVDHRAGTLVTSLAHARQGGIWFGLRRGGFGSCDGADLTLAGNGAWGAADLNIHAIRETAAGDLWLATEAMAARLAGGTTFESILTTNTSTDYYNVLCLHEDAEGRVWLGAARGGLFYWEKGKLSKFPDPALDELLINCVITDARGQLWVGTQFGLRCYAKDFKNQGLTFPWYATAALLADRHGAVWAGTLGGGLVRFLDGTLSQLRKADGLADEFVTALLEDQEGSLWVGTRSGLSQLSDVRIPTFGKAEGLTADVNVDVAPSRRGGLWIATSDGFAYFDGTAHPCSAELPSRYLLNIFEASDGDLYLADGKMGVEVFHGDKIVARYRNQTWPMSFAEDARGVVVAVGGSLFRVGTGLYEPYTLTNGGRLGLQWIFHLAPGRGGAIWVAADEGIGCLRDGAFQLWPTSSRPGTAKVRWVCEDGDGIVWGGLETGLARLKDGRLTIITRDDGLFDSVLNAVVPDEAGNLWIDSSRGFFRVSRSSLDAFAEGRSPRVEYTGFDGPDAVKSAEKYQQRPAGCRTSDGRIWFPTALGVAMIEPTNSTTAPLLPSVHLEGLRANGRELRPGGSHLVAPGKGDLEFHYAGLSYVAPLKVRYRYRLVGYDKDWLDVGARRSAFYTNLKPGSYRFEVQAGVQDGGWNWSTATCRVELKPHFYQTAWFLCLAGVGVIVVLLAIYGWRTDHLERKQQQLQQANDLLEAKVQERTAELARSNTTLRAEIQERQRMESEVAAVHRQLVDASRQAGQAEVASSVLHNVGNVLNSVNVSTSILGERLRGLPIANLGKACQLIQQHSADLAGFLTTDEKGRRLPEYFRRVAQVLAEEREKLLEEAHSLSQNVDHIKEIVSMQQTHARRVGVRETVVLSDLADHALKLYAGRSHHPIQVVREFEAIPPLVLDKHKLLQVLVNLLQNARVACEEAQLAENRVTVRIHRHGDNHVRIEVADNGVGIPPENLTRIFRGGFTTRKQGHGFGLHSAALTAREMGGTLQAQSPGRGQGATFILELPLSASPAPGAAVQPPKAPQLTLADVG